MKTVNHRRNCTCHSQAHKTVTLSAECTGCGKIVKIATCERAIARVSKFLKSGDQTQCKCGCSKFK